MRIAPYAIVSYNQKNDLVKHFGLILLNEMSDDIVHWYKSEQNFVSLKGETITIIGMKNTKIITEITKLALASMT